MKIRLKLRKSHFIALLLVLFPVANTVGGIFSYYDELIGVIGLMVGTLLFFKGELDNANSLIYILLLLITAIGIVSNYFSNLVHIERAIMLDILALWKVYMAFMFFWYITKNNKATYVFDSLEQLAKIMVIITSTLAIVGQIVDIGVNINGKFSTSNKYGFVWNNAIQTGWLLFACLLIIASASKATKKTVYKYIAIGAVPMLLTQSTLVGCWLFVVVFLVLFLRQDKKFKVRYIIFMVLGIASFSMLDISEYFINGEAVRMKFLRYAVTTANTYWPLGSGFATYGTDMAAKYYSPLYIRYGWENTWTMGRDSVYLNDTFFAGILGQFGWIGFILYLMLLVLLYREFNTVKLNKMQRIMCIATIITIAVVMIGSASAKSMMGVFMFSVLGVMYSKKESLMEKEI